METARNPIRFHEYAIGIFSILFGLILIAFAIYFGILALGQMERSLYADFPCDDYAYPAGLVQADTRVAYCIDGIGRDVVSGAGIAAQGISARDQTTLEVGDGFDAIGLERQGQSLKVNGRGLRAGQSWKKTTWFTSENPWLLYANRLSLQYFVGIYTPHPILVTGTLSEGWLPNPIGPFSLIVGFSSVLLGREVIRHKGKNKSDDEEVDDEQSTELP